MSATGGAAAARVPGHPGAWLVFAPLLALVGLRWVLAWLQERAGAPPAWPLVPFEGAQDPWGWLAGAGWVLGGLALLALAGAGLRRRCGPRALWRALAALWIGAALAGCGAQGLQFLNLRGLVAQPRPLAARVLGARSVAPSQRSAGGTLLVLQLPGEPAQQALIDDPAAAALPAGQMLALHWARGRWWGRYATGWQRGAPADAPR